MPDRAPSSALDASQLESMRLRLVSLEKRARIALMRAEGELKGEDADLFRELGATGDGAVAEAEFERDVAGAQLARRVLAALEAAGARLADGRYGWCDDCGAAIGLARLEAQPTATRCLKCQERAEAGPPGAASRRVG